MRGLIITIAASAGLLLTGAPALAATPLQVDWSSSCSKSTCFDSNGVFTETWSAADAKGPVDITQFLMARGVLGALDGQTFRVSFSIGGHEVGSWGSFNMAGIVGDTLHFSGQGFVWNPEDGDLVLTLQMGSVGGGGGGSFFFSAPRDGGFGGPGGDSPSPGDNSPPPSGGDSGAVEVTLPTAIPEPSAWALMIAGFGLAGAAVRRRRSVAGAQPCG